jgi:hypothetical protein
MYRITVIFSLSSVMEEDASLDDIIITDDADGKVGCAGGYGQIKITVS